MKTTMPRTTERAHAAGRLLAGLLTLLVAAPALAQNTTATITVRVTNAGEAIGGATVTAMNADDGANARGAARADGSHLFTGLRPGPYLISAARAGGAKPVDRLVQVGVGQTLDVGLDVADVAVADTVVIDTGFAETTTSEIATNVSKEQLNNLPQGSRNFLNLAQLAPGVRLSNNEFNKQYSSGALEARHMNVFVDGVSLKNNVIEGGVVGQDSSRGNPFPQLALGGFRVISQNFKAEYEQAGGAIISAVTRSGGNEVKGDVFTSYQNGNMQARDTFDIRNRRVRPELTRVQGGAAVSGPIVKDKLFFFGTYEGNLQDRANRVTIGNASPENVSRFGSYQGNFESPFREHLGFAKLTWHPADGQHLDVSASLRRETDVRSFGGQTSFENAENVRNNVFTGVAQHHLWLGSLTNEATFQVLDSQFNPTALNEGAVGREYAGVIRVGGRDTTQDIGQRAITLRDDLTIANLDLGGPHVVKVGAKVSFQRYSVVKRLFGNPLFRYFDDSANGLSFDFPAEASYGVGDPEVSADNTQFGVYAQDDWQLGKRFTLNAGLRWDVETNPLNNDHQTPESHGVSRRLPDWIAL